MKLSIHYMKMGEMKNNLYLLNQDLLQLIVKLHVIQVVQQKGSYKAQLSQASGPHIPSCQKYLNFTKIRATQERRVAKPTYPGQWQLPRMQDPTCLGRQASQPTSLRQPKFHTQKLSNLKKRAFEFDVPTTLLSTGLPNYNCINSDCE